MWQLVPYYSDDVVIRNIKVLAPAHSPNTDAIDPFSSSNVVIDHVYADVGDDDIAIKSGPINSPGRTIRAATLPLPTALFCMARTFGWERNCRGSQEYPCEHIRFEGQTMAFA